MPIIVSFNILHKVKRVKVAVCCFLSLLLMTCCNVERLLRDKGFWCTINNFEISV